MQRGDTPRVLSQPIPRSRHSIFDIPDTERSMGDYRKLDVWRDAHELVLAVYSATGGFPDTERYGLTSQLRRAVMSIPTNIAEGCGRNGDSEFARFVGIALGSANELDYLLTVSQDLGIINQATFTSCTTALTSIRNRLATLQRRLRSATQKPKER